MSAEPSRPSPYGSPGEPPLRHRFRPPPGGRGELREKGWIPFRWFALWWVLLILGDIVFYVLLTPVWIGLRAAAWVAELRSRASDRAGRRRRGAT